MTNNILKRLSVSILISTATIISTFAQDIKSAINQFKDNNYKSAISQLETLVKRNERDATINYYLGASYICDGTNISEGIRRVKFSQVKGIVSDSYLYLGRGYQLNYEFEQAISSYNRYLKTAKDHELIELAHKYMAECEASIPLASKIFNLRVIDKYRVTPDSLLEVYSPSHEVGSIAHNSDFFESNIDPNGYLYKTERGDAVYFSLHNSLNKEKLYKIEKLLDGWGEMVPLKGLESEGNDKMPVMMTDGSTLYFASDRAGGMGGYDIYKTTYDTENGSYTTPINMGVPFNSAFDDYLFVGDEFKQRAWFASNRSTSADSVIVYEILWDESVIKNFAQTTEEIRAASQLDFDMELANLRHNNAESKANDNTDNQHSMSNEIKLFEFQINDTLTYTDWKHFRSNEAKHTYKEAFDMKTLRDSLSYDMAQRRKVFMTTSDDETRNETVAKVLAIERRIYTIDDQITQLKNNARIIETNKLQEMIADGQSIDISGTKTEVKEVEFDWTALLNPEQIEMFSQNEFYNAKSDSSFYATLFTTEEVADLLKADSLMAWGNILCLEATKLSEKALNGQNKIITNTEGEKTELSPAETAELSEHCRRAAFTLYNTSLDSKYDIIDDRIEAAINEEPNIDFAEIKEQQGTAEAMFSSVESITIGNGMPAYEKAAGVKRKAMFEFKKALERYSQHLDLSFRLPTKKDNVSETITVQDALAERPSQVIQSDTTNVAVGSQIATFDAQKLDHIGAKAPNEHVEQPKTEINSASTADKPVYKIQLGVFRNKPDENKMKQLSQISSIEIPEKGLVKYFSGSYKTYSEAIDNIAQARDAGFSGCFVVAFINNVQVKLSEAQKLE